MSASSSLGAEASGLAARGVRPLLLVLAALAVLPFLNGLTGDFCYDDKIIIRDNPRLSHPSRLGEVFTTHYFGGSLATGTAYRPVVLVTYAVQRWVFGNRPFPFHVVNVALHAGVTLLLFLWLLDLGFASDPSLAVAALFAVSTIHVEAVTSLVGRAEVLAALLVLLSARLWLRATREGGRLRPLPYAACLLSFLVAVFVKENAVVVPGVVFLGELFRDPSSPAGPLERVRSLLRQRWASLLGLLAPVAALFAVRWLVLKGFLISREAGIFDLENPLVVLSPLARFSNATILLFRYVAKTLVPVGLSSDHSANALALARGAADPVAVAALLALLVCAALTVVLVRWRPLAAFGGLLFFGTLLPTSNLLFPIGTIYAERLAYLPSAGLLAMAVGLLVPFHLEVPRPSRIPWREGLVAAALLAYGVGTAARNRVFRDDATLYADQVAKMPASAKARYNLAFDSQRRGDAVTARGELETAVRLFPRYYDAWALLGKIAWDEKRWDDAIAGYRRAVEIFPRYENGRWGLAKTLEESGRRQEALVAFREGIATLPASYPLAYHHAGLLEETGSLEPALLEWARAVRLSDGASAARLGHAKALRRAGRNEEALEELRWALASDASSLEARLLLAELYEEGGKTLAAVNELTRALRGHPTDEDVAARLLEMGLARPETRRRAATCLPIARRIPVKGGRLRAALSGYVG